MTNVCLSNFSKIKRSKKLMILLNNIMLSNKIIVF